MQAAVRTLDRRSLKRRFSVACLRSLLQRPSARVVSELPQEAVEPLCQSLGRNTKPILKDSLRAAEADWWFKGQDCRVILVRFLTGGIAYPSSPQPAPWPIQEISGA
jgi:hypothetical protein